MTRDPLVVFTPSGKRGHFPVGTPLLQAARSLGVDIDSVCGGRGLAGAARFWSLRANSPSMVCPLQPPASRLSANRNNASPGVCPWRQAAVCRVRRESRRMW